MDFKFIYDKVEEEFDSIIATMVVVAMTINLVENVKPKDMVEAGRFTKRINKKTRKALWEHNGEDIELSIKIRDAWTEFESRIVMDGLGGCQERTLKQIIGMEN